MSNGFSSPSSGFHIVSSFFPSALLIIVSDSEEIGSVSESGRSFTNVSSGISELSPGILVIGFSSLFSGTESGRVIETS